MIWLLKWFVYLNIFLAAEIMVYGFMRVFNKSISWEERKSMYMTTYLPMIIIYSILPLSFELFISLFNFQGWWMLLYIPIDFIYGFIVTTLLESLLGLILFKTIGTCPWGKFTKEQRGILWGFSRWDWSIVYGLMAIIFNLFLIAFNNLLK